MPYSCLDERLSVLALWYIVNTSLSSYYKLIRAFGSADTALAQTSAAWRELSIHAAHLKRFDDGDDVLAFVERVQEQLRVSAYGVLYEQDDAYPAQLRQIYDPPPMLFYRGDVSLLSKRQIAIVGSRNPSEDAQKITFDMAQYLAQKGMVITSGLAQGVDRFAHLGALSHHEPSGQTVGVMGTGIDVCYPKNHNALFAQIIKEGGCLLTELLPATPASKHTFPRRNRLVAGLSVATLVTEAALQSGSLITARLSAEQGKQVFAMPSTIHNTNAQGCHHLIREGATLVYHPEQILEDLQSVNFMYNALPKTFSQGVSVLGDDDSWQSHESGVSRETTKLNAWQSQQPKHHQVISKPTDIPTHLQPVWQVLGDVPMDLDSLVSVSGLMASEILAGLMELEILGVVEQLGGRYVKS